MKIRSRLETDESYDEGDFVKIVLKGGQVHTFHLSDKVIDAQDFALLDATIRAIKDKWGIEP